MEKLDNNCLDSIKMMPSHPLGVIVNSMFIGRVNHGEA